MDFFEFQERKHKARPLTAFESPREPKKFVPRSFNLIKGVIF